MTGTGPIVLVFVALLAAVLAWLHMFGRARAGVWTRTWHAAAGLSLAAVAGLAAAGELDDAVGAISVTEAGVGVAAGVGWILLTHAGHRVLCRVVPTFTDRLADLYALRAGTPARRMLGPIVAMGIAEELIFRGVIQFHAGLAVAVGAYAAVQLVERNWALVLAAALSGLVWGLLFAWRDGLVAPVVAHVLWTAVLAVGWPLPAGTSDAAPRHAVAGEVR